MFFQKDIETMPRKDLEKLQLERLKWLVGYCIDNIPFYSKRLAEAKVTPEKIKSLSDIQYIPYTTKADKRSDAVALESKISQDFRKILGI